MNDNVTYLEIVNTSVNTWVTAVTSFNLPHNC